MIRIGSQLASVVAGLFPISRAVTGARIPQTPPKSPSKSAGLLTLLNRRPLVAGTPKSPAPDGSYAGFSFAIRAFLFGVALLFACGESGTGSDSDGGGFVEGDGAIQKDGGEEPPYPIEIVSLDSYDQPGANNSFGCVMSRVVGTGAATEMLSSASLAGGVPVNPVTWEIYRRPPKGMTKLESPPFDGEFRPDDFVGHRGGSDAEAHSITICADQSCAKFQAKSGAMVAGVSNLFSHIYDRKRRDLADTTEIVDQTIDGVPANGDSFDHDATDDGRRVIYQSTNTNLAPGNSGEGTFVTDTDTHATTLLMTGTTSHPAISGDGHTVVTADSNGILQLFHELDGRWEGPTPLEYGRYPSLNRDGTILTYQRIRQEGSSGRLEVVWVDLDNQSETTTPLVAPGIQGYGVNASVKGSGRFITFDWVDDTDPDHLMSYIYLLDRTSGRVKKISVSRFGAGRGQADSPKISPDERNICFAGSDLLGGDETSAQIYRVGPLK